MQTGRAIRANDAESEEMGLRCDGETKDTGQPKHFPHIKHI